MAMIEINIHIPIDGVNNISIPIQLPVVPRVGEKIYLSDKQINNLISLLEEEYYHNPQTEEWKESIRRFTNIAYSGGYPFSISGDIRSVPS